SSRNQAVLRLLREASSQRRPRPTRGYSRPKKELDRPSKCRVVPIHARPGRRSSVIAHTTSVGFSDRVDERAPSVSRTFQSHREGSEDFRAFKICRRVRRGLLPRVSIIPESESATSSTYEEVSLQHTSNIILSGWRRTLRVPCQTNRTVHRRQVSGNDGLG